MRRWILWALLALTLVPLTLDADQLRWRLVATGEPTPPGPDEPPPDDPPVDPPGTSPYALGWDITNELTDTRDRLQGADEPLFQEWINYLGGGGSYTSTGLLQSRNGTTIFGVEDVPGTIIAAPTSSAGAAGLLGGDKVGAGASFVWKIAPLTASGVVRPTSHASIALTLTEQQGVLNWDDDPDVTVSGYNVYRSRDGGAYKFVATVSGRTNSAYTDNVPHATVNAAAEYQWNMYGQDAGQLAMAFGDLYVLNPEHASWATAGVSWPDAINTQAELDALANAIWRHSTRTRGGSSWSQDGRTLYEKTLDLITTSTRTTRGDGPTPHCWSDWPAAIYHWAPYVYQRLSGVMSAGELTDINAILRHMLTVGLADLAAETSDYPKITTQEGWNNTSTCYWRFLTVPGLVTTIDTGLWTSEEQDMLDSALNKFYLRTKLEYGTAYYRGGRPGLHEASAGGYDRDNVLGATRLKLFWRPTSGYNDVIPNAWFQRVHREWAARTLPALWDTSSNFQAYTTRWGIVAGHNNWDIDAPTLALTLALMNRLGYTTEAGEFLWMMEQFDVSFTTLGGCKVPSASYGTDDEEYFLAWHWLIVMGSMCGITSTPITSWTTSAGPMKYGIWNNYLSAPSHAAASSPLTASLVQAAYSDVKYYGHTSNDKWHLSVWTNGGYLVVPQIGQTKSGFGNSSTGGVRANSRTMLWEDGVGGDLGGLLANTDAVSDLANLSNGNSSFERLSIRYGDDVDDVNGGYIGSQIDYATGKITTWQEEVFAKLDDNLVVQFHRITPVDPTNDVIATQLALPVQPDFESCTETKVGLGVWRCQGMTSGTVRVINDTGGVFTATHNDGAATDSQTWPDANVNGLIHIVDASSFDLYYFGYDPTYTYAALRNNLEIQLLGRTATQWNRNNRSWRRGRSCAYTDGASTRIYLSCVLDPETQASRAVTDADLPDTLVGKGFAQSAGGAPGFRTITSVDRTTTPKSIIVSGATFNWPVGSERHYDLLDDGTSTNEMVFDLNGQTMGDHVRRVIGAGILAAVAPGANAARTERWTVMQLGSNDSPPTAATITQFTDADTNGILVTVGSTRRAFAADPTHPSATDSTTWDASTVDDVPTTSAFEIERVNLRPGSAWSVTCTLPGGGVSRLTLSNSGGAIVVNSSGRLVLSVTANCGSVTPL